MSHELVILLITAASIGFFHTVFGPDHYLPFIVFRRARRWSMARTGLITLLCGLGHVGSSVVIGLVGIVLGISLSHLQAAESIRGNIAAWALIAFGLVYFVWGMRRAVRNRPHTHLHAHRDAHVHSHRHIHDKEHLHVHADPESVSLTPWVLFTIFVLGPCEPLIPLLMVPAAQNSTRDLLWVTAVFGIVTIGTMVTMVSLLSLGIDLLPLKKVEQYTHALAGAALFLCGVSIQFLGL